MHRRSLLRATVAAFGVAIVGAAALPSAVRANEFVEFTPGVIDDAIASGKAVLIDYAADWCSTCRAQERALGSLRLEHPVYDEKIVFVRVDWDQYRRHPVTTDRRIPRRSTLVLLQGDAELGRLVAQTGRGAIKELLDMAL